MVRCREIIEFVPVVTLEKTDKLKIRIPKGIAKTIFRYPTTAVTAEIEMLCTTFHFDLKRAGYARPDNIVIPLGNKRFDGLQCELPLQSADNSVVTVAIGISYKTDRGIGIYDRQFYAGKIIEVYNIIDGNVVEFKYPEKVQDQCIEKEDNGIRWEPLED